MLIEDRSTTPDFPPEAHAAGPSACCRGVMFLLLAAVAAFIVSAFALSGAGIEEDSSSLARSVRTRSGKRRSVTATA